MGEPEKGAKDRREREGGGELLWPEKRSESVKAFPLVSAEDAADSSFPLFSERLHLPSSNHQHPTPYRLPRPSCTWDKGSALPEVLVPKP